MTKFQAKVADYDQYAPVVLHDTVKIQKLQMAFSADCELMGKIACDHKANRKTVRTNDFAYIFTEMQDAAARLDAADKYAKLCSQSARIIPYNVNHTDIVKNLPSPPDNTYPFDHFKAMFSAIDIISSSDPNTLLTFAAHQQQCNRRQACPRQDLTTQLENNVYSKMPDMFKNWWCLASDADKCAYSQLIPSSSLYSRTSSANSSTIIPCRSVNFMDRDDSPLTSATFEHMANNAGLQTITDLQAFTAQAVSSHTVDGGDTDEDCLMLSINNATNTPRKSKELKEIKVPAPPASLLDITK